MHGQGFAEGAGLTHEHAAALAQGAVDGFDDVGLALAPGKGQCCQRGSTLASAFHWSVKYQQWR